MQSLASPTRRRGDALRWRGDQNALHYLFRPRARAVRSVVVTHTLVRNRHVSRLTSTKKKSRLAPFPPPPQLAGFRPCTTCSVM